MTARRLWLFVFSWPVAVAAAGASRPTPLLLLVAAAAAAASVIMSLHLGALCAATVAAAAWMAAIGPWTDPSRYGFAAAGAIVMGVVVVSLARWQVRAAAAAAAVLVLAPVVTVRGAPTEGDRPGPSLAAVDEYLQRQVDVAQIPGVAVAIVQDGRVVFARGYGDAGDSRPMTVDTPVVIGSTSKSITAVAVLQLVERGRVDLGARIGVYLPWFAPSDHRASGITVRDLLVDTSGIPTWAGWAALGGDGRADPDAIRELVNSIRLTSAPGERFQYSNANYIILGQIIEAVTGQTYASVVEQSIFRPLGMASSRAAGTTASTPNRYWFGVPVPSHLPYLEVGIPAGAITSSARDLARYVSVQLGGAPAPGGPSILGTTTLELSHTPAVAAEGFGVPPGRQYAMGWYTGDVAGEPAVFHAGDVFDSSSSLVLLPDRRTGVAVVATASSAITPIANTLAEGVVATLVGRTAPDLGRSLALGTVAVVAIGAALLAFAVTRARRLLTQPPAFTARLVIADVLVPTVHLLGLPLLFSRFLDRAETLSPVTFWVLVTRGLPDLGLLVVVALLLRLGTGMLVGGRRLRQRSVREADTVLAVGTAPVLDDLAVADAQDRGAVDLHRLA